jgi:hypothetical protein
VLRQTRERVLRGNTKAEGKLLSIFETHTEVIRKGKAHKPNEFGKLVLIEKSTGARASHLRYFAFLGGGIMAETYAAPTLQEHASQRLWKVAVH